MSTPKHIPNKMTSDIPSPPQTGNTEATKKRSFSFGNTFRPRESSDPTRSDASSGGGNIGHGRVKEFLASMGGSRKKSSSSLAGQATPLSPPTPPDRRLAAVYDTTQAMSELQVDVAPKDPSTYLPASPPPTVAKSLTDPFRQAVLDAERTVDKLSTAYTLLSSLSQLASVGQELLPGLGAAIGFVANMLQSAKAVGISKAAALRLVERSALILLGVQQAMIDAGGKVSPVMRFNVQNLLTNIHTNAELLSRLASKPFFEMYFKADEYARQIAKGSEDLSDFVRLFDLQAQIDVGAWRLQMEEDRQRDFSLLMSKLQRVVETGDDILHVLEIQREQQQEAIAALQRRFDTFAAMQQRDFDRHSPDSMQYSSQLNPSPVAADLTRDVRATADNHQTGTTSSSSTSGSEDAGPEFSRGVYKRRFSMSEHRAFEEKALDALQRNSGPTDHEVADWVITFLEVSREERVKTSFFSEVWRGTYQGQVVAVKQLAPVADRLLFLKEVEVWRRLRSPFVLPFLGASSTTGPPPWFLISPYMRHGSIVEYLQTDMGKTANKFSIIHQIAMGMDYLHSRDVLHGDLKAANVLFDDVGNIRICDFGLSQLKIDITRKSEAAAVQAPVQGTMRWQSPERMAGGPLTWRCDVYSFAMTVYEVFTDSQIPFNQAHDEDVRRDIQRGLRPPRPDGMSESMWLLTARCWAQDPRLRPRFSIIAREISKMYPCKTRKDSAITTSTESSGPISWATAEEGEVRSEQQAISPQPNILRLPDVPEDDSSSSSSVISTNPPLENQRSFQNERAEKHYRHYLYHSFDDRLSYALWFPSPIKLGTVGYIRRGHFIELLDAHGPPKGSDSFPPMPYLDEFSSLQVTTTPVNVRGGLERQLDKFVAWTKFTKSGGGTSQKQIIRHLDFPLKAGRKQAALVVEDGECTMYQSFDEARAYLMANIEWILETFGDKHHIVREDVMIVVGTLTARYYAMIVSDFAPRTTVTFNIHADAARHPDEPWGTWSFNKQPPSNETIGKASQGGNKPASPPGPSQPIARSPPARPVDDLQLHYTCKVSTESPSPLDAVLIAKLKFAPGETEPTLYP